MADDIRNNDEWEKLLKQYPSLSVQKFDGDKTKVVMKKFLS